MCGDKNNKFLRTYYCVLKVLLAILAKEYASLRERYDSKRLASFITLDDFHEKEKSLSALCESLSLSLMMQDLVTHAMNQVKQVLVKIPSTEDIERSSQQPIIKRYVTVIRKKVVERSLLIKEHRDFSDWAKKTYTKDKGSDWCFVNNDSEMPLSPTPPSKLSVLKSVLSRNLLKIGWF
jgi:hypothetical protein